MFDYESEAIEVDKSAKGYIVQVLDWDLDFRLPYDYWLHTQRILWWRVVLLFIN